VPVPERRNLASMMREARGGDINEAPPMHELLKALDSNQ
jgi:hypothetical protein